MRLVRRLSIAAAGVLAAAIGMGGCSSGSKQATGAGPTVPAAARPAPVATSGATVRGADLAARVGAAMTRAGTGRVTITVGGSDSTALVRFATGLLDERLTMPVENSSMDLLLVGGALYVSGMPGQATTWVVLDPTATTNPMTRFFMAALRTGFTDPATFATALATTTATVTDATAERVSYTVTVDPRALLEGSAFGLEMPTGSTVGLTLVLDAADRPITIVMTVAGLTVSAAYTDWGAPVDIAAPPPADVGPFVSPAAG